MATEVTNTSLPKELPMVPSRLHNSTLPTFVIGWDSGRIRRSIKVKEPTVVIGKSGGSLEAAENAALPWNLRKKTPKSYQGEFLESSSTKEKLVKRKFSVSLSKEDIEIDFLLMNGKKPHKRPKKRSKQVQKQLDALFPGMWLSEVTPDQYKVK